MISQSGSVFLEPLDFWEKGGKKQLIQFVVSALTAAEEKKTTFPFLLRPFVWQLRPPRKVGQGRLLSRGENMYVGNHISPEKLTVEVKS